MRAALAELGVDYDRLRNIEHDAALGNGGLGRLAACFMESMATLCIAAHGYGIRYDHGMFRQVIKDGWQHEYPENWLAFGNPWEVARSDVRHQIGFGGTVETPTEPDGEPASSGIPLKRSTRSRLRHASDRLARPFRQYAAALVGVGHGSVAARCIQSRRPCRARWNRARAPTSISQVLYPSDDTPAGQELRLRQEYFFTSASLQDSGWAAHPPARRHPHAADKAAIQLNDTHPAIAVAELMRILVDLHRFPGTRRGSITTDTISYTNHTLLPEALESWPVSLMERLLPRHMQIVYQINRLHLDAVCALPNARTGRRSPRYR